jgi:hypothetical protein
MVEERAGESGRERAGRRTTIEMEVVKGES